jgi:hypothetical protein
MSSVDVCVGLLEFVVCCIEGERSKHGFDATIIFQLVLFCFASFA